MGEGQRSRGFRDAASRLNQVLSKGKTGTRGSRIGDIRSILSTIVEDLSSDDAAVHKVGKDDKDAADAANAAQELASTLARATVPAVTDMDVNEDVDKEEDDEDQRNRTRSRVIRRCAQVAPAALQALELLVAKTNPPEIAADQVLLTLAAFTVNTPDWRLSDQDSRRASTVLAQLLGSGDNAKETFIVEGILQRHLRPLFSKSKPTSVTESGRKAEFTDPAAGRGEGIPDDSAATKPWKYLDFRAIPLVAWAVDEANATLVEKRWPLFLPVLLTLVDDTASDIRQRGLEILGNFIDKLPSKTLHGAGLASVFEDAIIPTLSYLPSLTPEDESVQLFVPTFEALRRLARKQPTPAGQFKNKTLDRLLREGVFHGYYYAGEHVRIVEVLCRELIPTLNEMGIHAVKHLKDLIPMLAAIMTDPFASASPSLLLSAVSALQAVLTNCWPRIATPLWRDEIIQAVVFCWLRVSETDSQDNRAIKEKLLVSVRTLSAILAAQEVNLVDLAAQLVKKEPVLAELFTSASASASAS